LYPLACPSTFLGNEHKPGLFDHWRFRPATIAFADHRLTDPAPHSFASVQTDNLQPAATLALIH
jgi:hypothetical protein